MLRMKSYFCANVEAAVMQARQELGPDALLVDFKEAPPEAVHLGRMEVIFATEAGSEPPVQPVPAKGSDLHNLEAQIEELRKQFKQFRVLEPSTDRSRAGQQPAGDATRVLLDAGLAQSVAVTIAEQSHRSAEEQHAPEGGSGPRVVTTIQASRPRDLVSALTQTVAGNLRTNSGEAVRRGHGAIVLVGPSGAGKTSTLVKLACRYGVGRCPIQLVSMDFNRIGAVEQLRAYAAILGAGFHTPDSIFALRQVVECYGRKGLVLIDTPGFAPSTLSDAGELAEALAASVELERHLVLPASRRAADLLRTFEAYASFAPTHLIFTQLDETSSHGALISAALASDKPVSFVCNGPGIPEDLEEADSERLAAALLEPSTATAARSVA